MIKFLDLKALNKPFLDEFKTSFNDVLNSGRYLLGENVSSFEKSFAEFCHTKYSIGVGSGLDAIILILEALMLQGKLAQGDRVGVPANTFIATFIAISKVGLKVYPIDVCEETSNITLESLQHSDISDIKCLILVHLYGNINGAQNVTEFCQDRNILLIEDAAQAHGASYNGVRAGGFGVAAAFSFYPGKNLGALGDGGAITTSDCELMELITRLRNYGSSEKYVHKHIGYNSRLDELQAGFLSLKLSLLEQEIIARQNIAKRYLKEIENPLISLPDFILENGHSSALHLFVIKVSHRKKFMEFMKDNGVETLIHYPIPAYKQECYSNEFRGLQFSITDRLACEIVSIPIYSTLTEKDVSKIIKLCNEFRDEC